MSATIGSTQARALVAVALTLTLGPLGCSPGTPDSGRTAAEGEAELALYQLAAAWESADTTLLLDIFWPEATYDDFPNQTTYEGITEIVDYVTSAHTWGDDVYMNMGRIHVGSSGAVGEWVFSAVQSRPMGTRLPIATGLEVVLNGVTVVEMRDGRIVRAADYSDLVPMVLQLGGRIELPGGSVWTQEGGN